MNSFIGMPMPSHSHRSIRSQAILWLYLRPASIGCSSVLRSVLSVDDTGAKRKRATSGPARRDRHTVERQLGLLDIRMLFPGN